MKYDQKITRPVAESWATGIAFNLFTSAIVLLPLSLVYVLFSSRSEVEVVTGIFSGILLLLLGVLSLSWSLAMWRRKPWARTLLLVGAWICAVLAVFLAVSGVGLLFVRTMIPVGKIALAPWLLGLGLIALGILLAAYALFILWLFTRKAMRQVFAHEQRQTLATTAPQLIQGYALVTWTQVGIGVLALALMVLLSPFIVVGVSGLAPRAGLAAVFIILFLLVLGALLLWIIHIIASAMWNFKPWVRLLFIVFAWLSMAFSFFGPVSAFVQRQELFAIASSIASMLSSLALAALELWFLTHPLVKRLFTGHSASKRTRRSVE